MSFKIEGLEELQKSLKDIENQINPNTLFDWATKITKTAKEMCNDPECKRIRLKRNSSTEFEFEFSDKESIDCVLKAIQHHINYIPSLIRPLFEQNMKSWLEEKKKSFD